MVKNSQITAINSENNV